MPWSQFATGPEGDVHPASAAGCFHDVDRARQHRRGLVRQVLADEREGDASGAAAGTLLKQALPTEGALMGQIDVDPGFGPYLESLRKERGWSLRRLGEHVHISHQHVWDLERGKKRPSLQAAELLDDALDAGGRLVDMVRPVADPIEAPGRSLADAIRTPLQGSADLILEHLHSQLGMLAAVDGKHGAHAALVGTRGVVDVATAVARHTDDDAGLLSLAAQAAEFVGWLYRDTADATRASHWYERAMEFAQAGGDMAMQGFVLLRKSQMAYESRDGRRVHMLARAALDGPWRLPDRLHAEALLQVARGDLMLGRSITMHDIVERARDTAPDTNLMLREASCWIEAGEPERAAELYEASISKASVSERDSGYYRGRQAVAMAAAARPDRAAELAHEALLTSRKTGSLRTRQAVREARTALAPWRSRDALASLDDALSASG
ncbi:hypothetical protein GCM10027059_42610 [Myceligenerans halotolerans]